MEPRDYRRVRRLLQRRRPVGRSADGDFSNRLATARDASCGAPPAIGRCTPANGLRRSRTRSESSTARSSKSPSPTSPTASLPPRSQSARRNGDQPRPERSPGGQLVAGLVKHLHRGTRDRPPGAGGALALGDAEPAPASWALTSTRVPLRWSSSKFITDRRRRRAEGFGGAHRRGVRWRRCGRVARWSPRRGSCR